MDLISTLKISFVLFLTALVILAGIVFNKQSSVGIAKYTAEKLPISIQSQNYLVEFYAIKGERDCIVTVTDVRGFAATQMSCK